MSGQKQHKKDGMRKEKKTQRRREAFQQPIIGSVTPQPARDVSNLTDGEIAGAEKPDAERIRGRR